MDSFSSLSAERRAPAKRSVKTVPFVELLGGRVQGVISSGSDLQRVYVAFVAGGSGDYYCCTNNNRPCGGLRGAPCKHIHSLLDEAVAQFGPEAVAGYLGIALDAPDPSPKTAKQPAGARRLLSGLNGAQRKEPPGTVFSRFLDYLRFCELPRPLGPVPEMHWFCD